MKAANDNPFGAFTLKDFATRLSIGRSRSHELLNASELKARKSGGRTPIPRSDGGAYGEAKRQI